MADYEKEKKKIKKKTEPLSIIGAGTPLRMLGRYFLNKERKKQRKKFYEKKLLRNQYRF